MSAVTPSGPWALPIEHLRTLLAACPAWQAWTGVTGDAAQKRTRAKARVFPVYLPPPEAGVDREYTVDELGEMRPFGVTNVMDGASGLRLRKIAEQQFTQGGSLWLMLEDNVAEADVADPAAVELRFMNRVGAVISDLLDLAGTDGYLNVTAIETMTAATRPSDAEKTSFGDCIGVHLRLDYGV